MGKVTWLDRKIDQTEEYALMGLVKKQNLILALHSLWEKVSGKTIEISGAMCYTKTCENGVTRV